MNRGLYSVISGLNNARAGLAVTGHNMSNVKTSGYVRQQIIQDDFSYQGIGSNLQIGLGSDITMIRQIRDKYLDANYRSEVGRAAYHSAIYQTGNELENIYGELQSEYSTQTIMQDMWDAINELTTHPSGIETRSNFISTVVSFITKTENVEERMVKEQMNLNESIKEAVTRVNQLTTRINELNGIIPKEEASGQRANDYRDERNYCIDELSQLLKIEYKENLKGEVVVTTNGMELVAHGSVQQIGLRYTEPGSPLVEPVFSTESYILDYDPTYENAKALFSYTDYIGPEFGNDYGEIYGMVVARGLYLTDHTALRAVDYDPEEPTEAIYNTPSPIPGAPAVPTAAWPDPANYEDGVEDPQFFSDYQNYLDGIETYLDDMEEFLSDPANAALITGAGAVAADELAALDVYRNDTFQPMADEFSDLKLNYRRYAEFNATLCTIPSSQREIGLLFNHIVTMVNDTLTEDYAYDLEGTLNKDKIGGPTYIFLPKYRVGADLTDHDLYTLGDVEINPLLLDSDGYNYISLGRLNPDDPPTDTPARDDGTQAEALLDKWSEKTDIFEAIDGVDKMDVNNAYRHVINNVGVVTNKALSFYEGQVALVNEIDNKRLQISGVSLDEEMKNMMIYQHAFNAASRMISVIDSMLDKLINGTGRVGL